jgi:hypothetical protein
MAMGFRIELVRLAPGPRVVAVQRGDAHVDIAAAGEAGSARCSLELESALLRDPQARGVLGLGVWHIGLRVSVAGWTGTERPARLNLDGWTSVMYRLVRVMWLGGVVVLVAVGTSKER